MIVKCPCQKCGANIEFEADDLERCGSSSHRILGQVIQCPHCDSPTQLYLNVAEFSQAKPKNLARNKGWFYWVNVSLTAMLLLCGVFYLGWLAVKYFQDIIHAAGIVIPSVVSLAIILFLIYWFVCLILLPIFVYRIHENIKKIVENTEPTKIDRK